jgi:transcriptional regulator with XRE-family HTH domain
VRLGPSSRRRAADISRAIGSRIAETRAAHGWGQRELAARVETTQSRICRIERGLLQSFDLELIVAVCDELGMRATFGAEIPILADRRGVTDLGHARCVAYLARRLRALDWEVATEVEVGKAPWLGWIDVLAFHARSQALVIEEVKTEIHDAGAEQRRLTRYEGAVIPAARQLGWEPRVIRSGIVLLATTKNDERLAELSGFAREAWPVRATRLLAWLEDPATEPPSGRSIAMIDPRSRRRRWLRATRLDGRRSPAAYRDYADFVRATRTRT